MQWDLTTILIAGGAFLVGYIAGLVEMHLRQSRKIKQLEEELRHKEPSRPQMAPPSSALRLWFDEQRTARVEMDGMILTSPAQIAPEQRRRLISLLTHFRPWVESQAVASPPPPSQTASPAARQPSPVPSPGSMTTVSTPPAIASSLSSGSIVEQINEILQKKLMGTPWVGQVRLRDKLGGGTEVWVGTKHYESVEEVAETEVKALIRAAIAEWEKSI